MKVSIIINCRNGKDYLPNALASAYGQTYPDFEVILIDNFSTDGSADFATATNPATRVFRCPQPMHLGAARNFGITKAKGDLICFHDVDDTWYPDKLSRQIGFMAENEVDFCYAGVTEITESGRVLRDFIPKGECGDFLSRLLLHFDINMVTPMLKRALVTPVEDAFDVDFHASEEYDLFLRLAVKHRFGAMDCVLGHYTVRENSLTNEKARYWYQERASTLRKLRGMLGARYADVHVEMEKARARGLYYLACYLMNTGRAKRARRIMGLISPLDPRYKILYLATFWPFSWEVAHRRNIKSILLRYIGVFRHVR